MVHLIDKDALVAEIKERIDRDNEMAASYSSNSEHDSFYRGKEKVYKDLLSFLDTLEVKEIDLEKEYKNFIKSDNGRSMFETAKHFFELGMRASSPITAADRGIAEEIIISLKQVENDYYLDQTKEIEWVRNKVKEGEI